MFIILILVWASVSVEGLATEPDPEMKCSRFSYEYRVVEKLINLRIELAKLDDRITDIELAEKKQPVVSTHVRLSGTTSLSGTERVMYDVEVSNIHEAYDFQTGQFTVPVAGVYLIHVNACLNNGGNWMDLNIVRDGSVIERVFVGDSSYHACGSKAMSIRFEVGDKIWVERVAGISANLNEDHGWNSFTATLVHSD